LWPWSCAWLTDFLYASIARELPEANRWGCCFTVFRPNVQAPWSAQHDQRRHGIQMLVGAEGPLGVRHNTQQAIQAGYRGFVMALFLPYGIQTRSEPWMFEDIERSVKQWQAHI